jgi:hypothetical protein
MASAEVVLRGRGLDSVSAKAAAAISRGNLTRALLYADPSWRAFLEKAPIDFDRALEGDEDSWMRVVDEYDKLDPGFWEDDDLTAGQRKNRVAEEFLRSTLAAWDVKTREQGTGAEPGRPDPVLVRASLQRHLDWLSSNLSARMVLDHLFLEVREIARTGRSEQVPWMDSAFQA